MIETSCVRSLSLVVANLTLSHVIAIVLLVVQRCHVICVSETPILCIGLGGKMIVNILWDIFLAELMVKLL